jgi:hypothetical protein
VLVALILAKYAVPVAVILVPVALINNKLLIVAVIAFKIVANKLVLVVVASVDVPDTVSLEVTVALLESERSEVFSTQLVPSHLRVEDVAVPEARAPLEATLIHLVEVPVLLSNCPTVPVAPNESLTELLSMTTPLKVEVAELRLAT